MNNTWTLRKVESTFLNFFQKRGHIFMPPTNLLPPEDDKTLLLINSGMAPLKKFFEGRVSPPNTRLTNAQPCLRVNDLDVIGDISHGTSFIMLGNWSFGDYNRKEALLWAWDLLTKEFGLDPDRMFITIFRNDDTIRLPDIQSDNESFDILNEIFSEEKIIWKGIDDNWWSAGDIGPCGPCAEIHYLLDDGVELEIWNAGVFMDYTKNSEGIITKMPMRCVDSGAGLERITMVLQEAKSIHELQEYSLIYQRILSEVKEHSFARLIFDHCKSISFLFDSGISIRNNGAGAIPKMLINNMLITLYRAGCSFDNLYTYFSEVREVVTRLPEGRFLEVKDSEILFSKRINSFSLILSETKKNFSKKVLNKEFSELELAEVLFRMWNQNGSPKILLQDLCIENSINFPEKDFDNLVDIHSEKSKQ